MVRAYTVFICFFLGQAFWLQGQSLFVGENQLLTIGPEASVVLEGALTNEGVLTNQGSLEVAGDWQNKQSYAGAGTVSLVGEDPQIIQHNNQSFATLVMDGDGRKKLESPVTVTEKLTLANGLVEASSENSLQLSSEATIEAGSVSSYVLGPIACSGTGYRFFPIGTEALFLPLTLEDVQGVNPVIQAQIISPNPDPVMGEGLERVDDQRYWSLDVLEGSFDGSLITLPVRSDNDFENLMGVVVAQTDAIGTDFTSLGQSARQGNHEDGWVTSRLPATLPILALGLTTDYALENAVAIPTAFAPDAISVEDQRLKIYAASLLPANFSFTIFNRWGQIVYQTDVLSDALSQGWDGTHFQTHEPLPVGVYHYVLRGIFETNQSVEKTGAITLFR